MTDKTTNVARMPEKQVSQPDRYVDPFSTFRVEMDRLMDDYLGANRLVLWPGLTSPLFDGATPGAMMPRMDVTEDNEKITVTAELPGLTEGDVELTLHDDVLVVKGEKRAGESRDEDNVYVSERRFGSFQRSIRMPENIDADAIDAHVENGVLTVTVPKKPEAKKPSRQIPVGKK